MLTQLTYVGLMSKVKHREIGSLQSVAYGSLPYTQDCSTTAEQLRMIQTESPNDEKEHMFYSS